MKYKLWCLVGSQFLYSPGMLKTDDARENKMAMAVSRAICYPIIYNETAKTNQEIPGMVVVNPDSDADVWAMVRAT